MWIRILAVGVVGLVVMGAVAALGRNPAPAPLTEAYPVAQSAGKADRLPLNNTEHDTAEAKVDASPAATKPTAPTQIATVTPLPSKPKADPAPSIISRHWHDPADSKFKSRKRAAVSERSQIVQDDKPRQAIEAKNCSESGLDTLLRSINLKPRCQ
ncbi:hypothetical protein ACFFWD_15160 [Bradyrhizobium erythrophlei]|uniref:hypothetical protein n=1 Tax=Bradyrhizobium erythrophlei TaxID=1437360 RepID=UPI0035E5ACEF